MLSRPNRKLNHGDNLWYVVRDKSSSFTDVSLKEGPLQEAKD